MKEAVVQLPKSDRAVAVGSYAISILALALIGRTLLLIFVLARPMPYWDAWEFMKALPAIFTRQYTAHDLFAFHNEHRIVTTRLLMLADVWFFAATGYLTTTLLPILLCAIGTLLAWVAVRTDGLGTAATTVAVSLLLSVAQWENYASGFQVQFPLVDLFAISSIGFIILSCAPGRFAWMLLGGAIIADALAIGSMASGNTVVAPVLLVAIARRAQLSRIACLVLPALLMSAAYLIGFPKPDVAPSYDVVGIAHFAVNYLGSALRGTSGAPLILGAGLLTAYAAILAGIARAWWRRTSMDPVLLWLAGVAAFSVIGAVVTAAGRLNLGMETSVSSRYAIQSLLFACCLFLMAWRLAGGLSRPAEARLGLAAACLALSAASTLSAKPLSEWRQRVDDYDVAGTAFANGVFSDNAVKGVYPFPELVRPALTFMAAHRLGSFSGRFAAVYRPPINTIAGTDLAATPACVAAQDRLGPVGPGWIELDGWAVDPSHPAEGGWVLAFDENGRMLGFTRQLQERPDVADALHMAKVRVGYRLALNASKEAPTSLRAVTVVLVPDDIKGAVCRAATVPIQAGR